MHKAGAARPGVFRQSVRDDGYVLELRHGGSVLGNPCRVIQVCRAATTPVQRGGTVDALVAHVLDQSLDGGKAGARGKQDDGLVRIFTQEEAAERAFHAQNFFFLHAAEDVVGELAAFHVTNVQLKAGCGFLHMRGGGHRVGAAGAVAQNEFHILTGVVLELFAGGQLQANLHHVVRFFLQRGHAHGHFLDGE